MTSRWSREESWRALSLHAALLIAYVASGRLGLSLDAASGFAAPFWPPTGIALGALMVGGEELAWTVALGALIVNILAGASWPTAMAIAAGNTMEAVVAVRMLRQWGDRRLFLDRPQDVLTLLWKGALFSTAISATVGVTTLLAAGITPVNKAPSTWAFWWVGDALGDLIVAPLLFVWTIPSRPTPSRWKEASLLASSVVASAAYVFWSPWRNASFFGVSATLVFPPLVWAALRFGPRGATLAVAAVSVAAVWGTAMGGGPFAGGSLGQSLLALQLFMSVVSVTVLLLAAEVAARRRVEMILNEARSDLELRVEERTAALARSNQALREEIAERQKAEGRLSQRESQLAQAQAVGHIGSWRWDVDDNRIVWTDELYRLYGLTPGEGVGGYEKFLSRIHPDDRERVRRTVDQSRRSGDSFSYDHRVIRSDGAVRWLHGQGQVMKNESGRVVTLLGTAQDITQRRRAEEEVRRLNEDLEARVQDRTHALEDTNDRLRTSLEEKETLLKEVHHRVKNNLQIVYSLINLQSRHVKDPKTLEGLEDCRERVRAMAMVHEKLYRSKDLGRIDFADYIRDLAKGLMRTYGAPEVSVRVEADGVRLGIDEAVPCGLVVHELVSNCLKHAFPGGRRGEVVVSLAREESGTLRLEVRDDGVGFPDSLDFRKASSLGLQLVCGLMRQLGGEIQRKEGSGTTFEIAFRAPESVHLQLPE